MRNYLLSVLGLSAFPRILTFGATLVSFPLMVSALGATEYGMFVFVGAITLILESGADFGVSSAAGKNIAEARESRIGSVRGEVRRWSRLQAATAAAGFIPMLVVTFVVAMRSSSIQLTGALVVVAVLASWFNISVSFTRASLTSLLQFKRLAVLDTFESVMRSGGFVIVAYTVPTAIGLAGAALITAASSGLVGGALLVSAVRGLPDSPGAPATGGGALPVRAMLRESASFLWLRVATRAYLSGPLVLIGKFFGAETVGIIGAITKIIDMVNFPAAVVGNALAVRASGIVATGSRAVQALWDAASRFIATSVLVAATFYFGADILGDLVLEGSPDAPMFITILSVSVTTTAIASLIVPMSDYVGGLRARNLLLTFAAMAQLPILWLASRAAGSVGALGTYVGVQALVTSGYLLIAQRAFYQGSRYRMRMELRYLLGLMVAALTVAALYPLVSLTAGLPVLRWHGGSLASIILLWVIVLIGLLAHRSARRHFLTMRFLDFESVEELGRNQR